ncbi:mediator of RNA polymerase II transcription subunit 6 isoform X1 [Ischnura elegans]|uniref:mediator of RNA polymerase II transcription subunit 6 isoform X1 n=1 Tax=Ischnura elegans TaxID=197161 RepID=UPI001ED8709F|nr:mediator of RNA polymerase II transcription subunit 6 isoform X1 [Ischnura elegans]
MTETKGNENPLGLSWHDSAWIPILNPSNILDYFCERNNPFFDRTCNNESIKMQRLAPEQLQNMTGPEYILLHVQEPILYVIRKQHRHSPTQATPLADYYIIAGVIYQAPDLGSVLNSRLLSTIHHLQSAFDETVSYSRYHPSKGYTWDLKEKNLKEKMAKKENAKEEPSSLFQRQRVDMLLTELTRKFPIKVPTLPAIDAKPNAVPEDVKPDIKVDVKIEKPDTPLSQQNARMKPPPEKKARLA